MTPNNLYKVLILLVPVGCVVEETPGVETGESTVYTSALSPAGAVVSPGSPGEPEPRNQRPAPAREPDLAWNGEGWLAVWTDLRSGNADIYAARVSPDGAVEPANGFAIANGAGDQDQPQVAWNGSRYLVTFTDRSTSYHHIRAARVTAAGLVLDPGGQAMGIAQELAHSSDVASIAGNFYVVWEGDCSVADCAGTVRGQRMSGAGLRGSPATLALSSVEPAIAANGTSYLVAWTAIGRDGRDIAARYVRANGTPHLAAPLSPSAGDQQAPAVAASGARFVLAWRDADSIRTTTLGGSTISSAAARVATGAIDGPALSGSPYGWAITWTERLGDDQVQVRGAAMDATGNTDSAWISATSPATGDDDLDRRRARIAFDGAGNDLLLAWHDHEDDGTLTVWAGQPGGDPFRAATLAD